MDAKLKELGINVVPVKVKNNKYVAELSSSDEYGKLYSILEKNEDVDYFSDMSSLNLDVSDIVYFYKDIELHLIADFNADTYELVIYEN